MSGVKLGRAGTDERRGTERGGGEEGLGARPDCKHKHNAADYLEL